MKRLSERLRRSSTASQRAATLPEMLEELRMLYRHLIETPKSTKLAGKTLHLSQVQGYLSDNPAYAITSASQVIWKGPLTLFPIGRNRPTQWDNSDSVQYENVVMWLEQSIESIEKTILLSPAKDLENNGCESHIQQPVELEPRSRGISDAIPKSKAVIAECESGASMDGEDEYVMVEEETEGYEEGIDRQGRIGMVEKAARKEDRPEPVEKLADMISQQSKQFFLGEGWPRWYW